MAGVVETKQNYTDIDDFRLRKPHLVIKVYKHYIWASAWYFQQCGILTCVDLDEPLQPPFKLRNSKWCSVSSLTILEWSSDKQRLWLVCTYAHADLSLCWSHILLCWKSHALDQFFFILITNSSECQTAYLWCRHQDILMCNNIEIVTQVFNISHRTKRLV